jgi:hypothetical protein
LTIRRNAQQKDWILPPATLLVVFLIQAARGLLLLDLRYSLVLGYLFLPFAAETVLRFRAKRHFQLVAVLLLFSMLPLSYSRVVLARTAGPDFPNPFPGDLEILPKISRPTRNIALAVANQYSDDAGLIIDFFGWKHTRYVALMSRLHPNQIWFMPGARHEKLNFSAFSSFIDKNPTGLLLRSDGSTPLSRTGSNSFTFESGGASVKLYVELLRKVEHITLYRYTSSMKR